MSATPQRRSLLERLDTPKAPLAEEAVQALATRHGFAAQAPQTANADDGVSAGRLRQKTGRDHPFSVRLRADTRAAIYAQANARNVPVAQIIEEAIDAISGQGRGRGA